MVKERHGNLFWPLLLIVLGVVMLLQVAGLMPAYLWDLLTRLWPLLLIIFGLAALIAKRTPTTNALILIGLFALVIVVFAAGYTRQALKLPDPQYRVTQTIDQDLEDASDVTLHINLSLTELVISAQDEASGHLTGTFIGSTETYLTADYERPAGNVGTLTLTETNVNPIPRLEEFGSNRLEIRLPPDVPFKLFIEGNVGNINMDLSRLNVNKVEASTSLGDVILILSEDAQMVGDLATAQGNVTLRYPESLPLSFKKTHEFEIGVNDQIPSGFESLGGGRWRPFIYTEAEVRVTLELSTRFGNIIVEHLVE